MFGIGLGGVGLGAGVGVPYGQVATRSYVPDSLIVANKQLKFVSAHYLRDSGDYLDLTFPNFYVGGYASDASYVEKAPGAPATLSGMFIRINGVDTPITFGGSSTGVVPDGGMLKADRVFVSFANGAMISVWGLLSCAAGVVVSLGTTGPVPANGVMTPYHDYVTAAPSGLTDWTMGASLPAYASGSFYAPVIIAGATAKPNFAFVGDSRDYGERDTPDASGDVGQSGRAIGQSWAYINMGIRGDTLVKFLASNSNRLAIASVASAIVMEYGINDLFNASPVQTSAQLAANETSLLALFPGKKVYIATIPPTTTGSWGSAGTQTTRAQEAERVSTNARRLAVPSGFAACLDYAFHTEDGLNPGKWKSPGYTADGTHLLQLAALAIKTGVASQVAAFTR